MELAHSSLTIVTYNKKSGLGLGRGLSPIFDMLVDRYIEMADLKNPHMALFYVKEGKIAMWVFIMFKKTYVQTIVCYFQI